MQNVFVLHPFLSTLAITWKNLFINEIIGFFFQFMDLRSRLLMFDHFRMKPLKYIPRLFLLPRQKNRNIKGGSRVESTHIKNLSYQEWITFLFSVLYLASKPIKSILIVHQRQIYRRTTLRLNGFWNQYYWWLTAWGLHHLHFERLTFSTIFDFSLIGPFLKLRK